jgi:hypothetical protein
MEDIPDEQLDGVLLYAGQLHEAFCKKRHSTWAIHGGCQFPNAMFRLWHMPNRSLWTRYGSLKNWVTCALRMRKLYSDPHDTIDHVRTCMPAGFNPLMYMANGRIEDA